MAWAVEPMFQWILAWLDSRLNAFVPFEVSREFCFQTRVTWFIVGMAFCGLLRMLSLLPCSSCAMILFVVDCGNLRSIFIMWIIFWCHKFLRGQWFCGAERVWYFCWGNFQWWMIHDDSVVGFDGFWFINMLWNVDDVDNRQLYFVLWWFCLTLMLSKCGKVVLLMFLTKY